MLETLLANAAAARTRLAKHAQEEFASFADWREAQRRAADFAKAHATGLKDVLAIGGIGLGVGAGLRGLLGLYQQANRNLEGLGPQTGPSMVSMPFPVASPERLLTRSERKKEELLKSSQAGAAEPSAWEIMKKDPLYLTAGLGAGVGGLYAGWKGIGAILNRRRQQEREEEMEAAKREFQSALLGQYDQPARKAAADADGLGAGLDRVYDDLVKVAGFWDEVKDYLRAGSNFYLPYAAVTG